MQQQTQTDDTSVTRSAPDDRLVDVAVFDVDGTLVDTNYHHALAWFRAFRAHDVTLPVWRLHRAIGMGGDQLVEAVAGRKVERDLGDDLRARWSDEVDSLLDEVRPFEGATELLREVRRRGLPVVLASSAKAKHLDHYLDLLDAREVVAAWTTADDVQESKPAPDLLDAAVRKVGGSAAVMVGDSTWDFVASRRAGHLGYAVRTGGFSEQELREAGAVAVFDSLLDLHDALDDTALRGCPPAR